MVASDAFFPFRDGLDVVDAGATCVIQPGGSVRDDEVIAAAAERDAVRVFTGVRHFRHRGRARRAAARWPAAVGHERVLSNGRFGASLSTSRARDR